jgi:hypothetical protein
MNIVALVRGAWQNTKDMPFLLRMYCQGAMVAAPLLLLFLSLPLFDWTVNDRPVPYAELWSSGAGMALSLLLALAGVGGWGLALRSSSARWAWVATPSVPLLALPLFPASPLLSGLRDASLIAGALLTSVAVYAVLFHTPAVRRHLAHGATGEQRA